MKTTTRTPHLEAATRLMIKVAVVALATGLITGATAVGVWQEGYYWLAALIIPGLPALTAFTFIYPTLKGW